MLQVEGISKSFGGVHAVNNCTLSVEERSITGLIGPNGAGKTTLFNLIAGTFTPDRGRVLFAGEDVTGAPTHTLFHKGIVRTFQIPHEFSRMTTRENLMMVPPGQPGEDILSAIFRWKQVLRHEAEVRRQADEVLDFIRLAHVSNEQAGNLSGGQKKLLELGRTMMTRPRIVLLDEPAAGVNRTLLNDLTDLIKRLNRERGCTFFLIEHDMNLVEKLCDPVICMAQGNVLVEGAFADVRGNKTVLEAYMGSAASPPSGAGQ